MEKKIVPNTELKIKGNKVWFKKYLNPALPNARPVSKSWGKDKPHADVDISGFWAKLLRKK